MLKSSGFGKTDSHYSSPLLLCLAPVSAAGSWPLLQSRVFATAAPFVMCARKSCRSTLGDINNFDDPMSAACRRDALGQIPRVRRGSRADHGRILAVVNQKMAYSRRRDSVLHHQAKPSLLPRSKQTSFRADRCSKSAAANT